MRSKGPIIFLILALVLAGVAAWAAHRWISNQASRQANTGPALIQVVVAAAKLPPGQRLEKKHLSIKGWPKEAVPPGSFRKTQLLVGRVLRTVVVKGEAILLFKLAPKGVAGGLSAIVPPGFRALTVRVDDVIGVGGFVKPGDRVDVLVTVTKGLYKEDPTTRTVLQDIPVLAVGDHLVEDPSKGKDKKGKKIKVKIVTLQLTPEQSEHLALAATWGKVLLALRNYGDREKQLTAGISMLSLVPTEGGTGGKLGCPKRARPSKATGTAKARVQGPVVEIIKGVVVSTQNL